MWRRLRRGPLSTFLVALTGCCLLAACDEGLGPATVPEPPTSPLSATDIAFALGAPEIVYDYSLDRCDVLDLPDMTARAVRPPGSPLVLYSGNAPRNYASFGPDFNQLRRNCTPTLVSDDNTGAASFSNYEWLSTVYYADGNYHALVHNEYHDPTSANCKAGDTSPANPCWYNAITYAVSADGRTFTQPAPSQHVVAGPPQKWDPSGARAPGPYGYFTPSNIIRAADGWYYALFFAIPERNTQAKRGSCLMRTQSLADPKSWRAWDGAAFTIAMPSPYDAAATGTPCAIVLSSDLNGSLTYNTYLGRYLYIGSAGTTQDGEVKCGFLFSISEDFIRWSPPRVIKQSPLPFPPCGSAGQLTGTEHYPSLIDHADTTINFERTGQSPHLYYMRYNNNGLDRDLVRVSVTIQLMGR